MDAVARAALRWYRGEYTNKMLARVLELANLWGHHWRVRVSHVKTRISEGEDGVLASRLLRVRRSRSTAVGQITQQTIKTGAREQKEVTWL